MKALSVFFCQRCRGQLRNLKRGEGAICLHRGCTITREYYGMRISFASGRGPVGQTMVRFDAAHGDEAEA